jgi:hypothetical protein
MLEWRRRWMQRCGRTLTLVLVSAASSGCSGGHAAASHDSAREHHGIAADARLACQGVPAGDLAPGLSGLEVIRVNVLERIVRYRGAVVEGSAAVVRTGGRSFEVMERLVRCRAARGALVSDPLDPLAVPGASVRVLRDDEDAAIVQIRSRNVERAKEIVRRMDRHVPGRGETDTDHVNAHRHPGAEDQGSRDRQPGTTPRGIAPPVAGPVRPSWLP